MKNKAKAVDDKKKLKKAKNKEVEAKVEKKSKKDSKELTPLEKARLARASGKAPNGSSKKKNAKKNALPTFQAPADFKPHFLSISVRTEKDGLLASGIKATRYQGSYDPEAEDKKKADLGSYDPATLIGIQARLAAVTYKTNPQKKYSTEVKTRMEEKGAMRLPANTSFRILLRINKKRADGSISIGFKTVEQAVKSAKTGKPTIKLLDKKDPAYRSFRKSARILPAAFKDVLMPPKRVRGAKVKDEDDE